MGENFLSYLEISRLTHFFTQIDALLLGDKGYLDEDLDYRLQDEKKRLPKLL